MRQARRSRPSPASGWAQGGVVSGTPTVPGPETGLNDLGRSVHRLALTHSRLRSRADAQVGCRAQDAQAQRWPAPMTRPAPEGSRRVRPPV